MKIPLYQIDAFTGVPFHGNPAAVCPLAEWLPDDLLQAIAAENNLSETAFFVRQESGYALRWFTPAREIDLCGHATLAAAYAIFRYIDTAAAAVEFATMSGPLTVTRSDELLEMDFPARPATAGPAPAALIRGLGGTPREVYFGRDCLAVFESEKQIPALRPDFEALRQVESVCIIATAPGKTADFVSRVFAPAVGIPEDPVTGSAHCTLVPYWAERLGKNRLHALQLSARGGELFCESKGERVTIAGRAVLFLEGVIHI